MPQTRRGSGAADRARMGGYATLVPCAAGEGWIGGERFNGGLGVVGFHCWVSFLWGYQSATHSARSAAVSSAVMPKRSCAAESAAMKSG